MMDALQREIIVHHINNFLQKLANGHNNAHFRTVRYITYMNKIYRNVTKTRTLFVFKMEKYIVNISNYKQLLSFDKIHKTNIYNLFKRFCIDMLNQNHFYNTYITRQNSSDYKKNRPVGLLYTMELYDIFSTHNITKIFGNIPIIDRFKYYFKKIMIEPLCALCDFIKSFIDIYDNDNEFKKYKNDVEILIKINMKHKYNISIPYELFSVN